MEELIQKVGRAKAYIDNGMCRVGKRLRPESGTHRLMAGGASRAVVLADAIVRLCRQDHPSEALPALRDLAETAVAMRWAAFSEDGERDAGVALLDLEDPRWERLWPSERLAERAGGAGVPADDIEAVCGLCRDFALSGRSAIPWSHVFPENRHPGVDASRVLSLSARMMGHVLTALDATWRGDFPGAEAMW